MTTQSHLDNISTPVIIGGQPLSGLVLAFGKIVVVDVLATSGRLGSPQTGMTSVDVGLNASVLALVSEDDDLSAAPFTGGLGAATKDILTAIFGAVRHPASVHVLSIDEAGGDTWGNIWAALALVYPSFYALVLSTDDLADIAAATAGVVALPSKHLVFAGLNDVDVAAAANATWVANAVGALTTAQKQRLWVSFHDKNAPLVGGQADFAEYAAAFLTADFRNKCPGGNRILQATSALATLTPTQKTNLDLNFVNHALPFYTTTTYVDPGFVQAGFGVYNMITTDLLENNIRNAFAAVKSSKVVLDLKVPMSRVGQALGVAAINGVVERMTSAEHLMPVADVAALRDIAKPPPYVKALPISAEDRTLGRLSFEVLAYSLQDARLFKVITYLQT